MRTSSDSLPDHSVLFRTFDISIFKFKSNKKQPNNSQFIKPNNSQFIKPIHQNKKRLEKNK